MERRRFPLLLLPLSLLLFIVACDRQDAGPADSAAADPRWSEHVSAHTRDDVSKHADIEVRFVHPVVDESRVGRPAEGLFVFDPPVAGRAEFTSVRSVRFRPRQPLASGRVYQVTVHTIGLQGIPAELGDFRFRFRVRPQDFELKIDGFRTDPDAPDKLLLAGRLLTADRESPEAIAATLRADYDDRTLKPVWQHDGDGRVHAFVITGLERGDHERELVLRWEGKAIGVDRRGTRRIPVPPAEAFRLLGARAIRDRQQYVQLTFSDALDPAQDLRGLVRLNGQDARARVNGNRLRIYPQTTLVGAVTVSVDAGIRNRAGTRLGQAVERQVVFAREKPRVRFVGKGIILPGNEVLSIPIEAINVHSLQVTAFRIYADNVGQFLQTNTLEGDRELHRVGRYLWRRTIHLNDPKPDQWNRYALDASELLRGEPGALYRLTLSIHRGNSLYDCPAEAAARPVKQAPPPRSYDDLNVKEASGWDFAEEYWSGSGYNAWHERDDPCKDGYYRFSENARAARNFLASNIGLLAKRDASGVLRVVATDIRRGAPLGGVAITVHNFQNHVIGRGETDDEGFASIPLDVTPFYLTARRKGETGYLKLSRGTARPISHFDTGGVKVRKGIKGHLFGERGVWRPGDTLHLTFVLQDPDDRVPDDHPVTLRLYNPRGQLVTEQTNAQPLDGFYVFHVKTAKDAPTGKWSARAILGGQTFSRSVRIETVIPNRLKVSLDFPDAVLSRAAMPVTAELAAQWLHGARAGGLQADVAVKLKAVPTRFTRFGNYVFDDPAREFNGVETEVFQGRLDDTGHARFKLDLQPAAEPPGMLEAHFVSRVHETGGAVSSTRQRIRYMPYTRFVGVRLPKGDAARGMLRTDTEHTVEIATLSDRGDPISVPRIRVSLYKIDWKWWWDKSGESLARYARGDHHEAVAEGLISTTDGRGQWSFRIDHPEWGRYLLRACDLEGHHCAGKVFYVDWPGWAGRAMEEQGAGANMFTFFPDKSRYTVGETARIRLPATSGGRILMSVEKGDRILAQRWIVIDGKARTVELPITTGMAPNVYVSMTLLQPHADKANDRPIRLYGVVPLQVDDPVTRLQPAIAAADEWRPERTVPVRVSEAQGRPMTYTLMVVDEGLLGLTGYRTPDLHAVFYRREALGVSTWDLFDAVTGAYGGELERLLALGGGDAEEPDEGEGERRRFPPLVRFLGPFRLDAGQVREHEIDLPRYVGAVRIMVVAGRDGAYGKAHKSVFVRQPLSLLPTVPRVLGPGEQVTLPVSVFVMNDRIRHVRLHLEGDDHFAIRGSQVAELAFDAPGEQLALLGAEVTDAIGTGTLRFVAEGGGEHSVAEIHIPIRAHNPPTQRITRHRLAPGETWTTDLEPHGLAGTNAYSLEVSVLPPIDLDRHLEYLIHYPHGCVEQITSAVFPQLLLPKLVDLNAAQRKAIARNVAAGIERLRRYQRSDGRFAYWPGGRVDNDWASIYAGHFLLEAQRLGHAVPLQVVDDWLAWQRQTAARWLDGTDRLRLVQAYRLYTLALAEQADIGAMNRLRSLTDLDPASRWLLAGAYALAGVRDVAGELVAGLQPTVPENRAAWSQTFGSRLRDQALLLQVLLVLDRQTEAAALAERIAAALASDTWHNTQALAWALSAMAAYGGAGQPQAFRYALATGESAWQRIESTRPLQRRERQPLPAEGLPLRLRNEAGRPLFATVVVRGVPPAGQEQAVANGLRLTVRYTNEQGEPVDIARLPQGSVVLARLQLQNLTERRIDDIALSQRLPAGWEIREPRLDDETLRQAGIDYQDVRDDRIDTYLGLAPGESRTITTRIAVTYPGRYYLPATTAEAMYDASRQARVPGQWIRVTRPGE